MQKKVWLSAAMAALGAAMLVAAAFAGPASSKSNRPSASGQKKGGTMNINMSGTDVDYIDPALPTAPSRGRSWMRPARSSCTTPTSRIRSGASSLPTRAVGFPTVSKDGKTYAFTVKSRHQVEHRRGADRRQLRRGDQPRPEPEDAVAGGSVHHGRQRHRRRAGRRRRQGRDRARRRRQGPEADDQAAKPDGSLLPKMAMNFFCPIPKGTPINADGINTFASFGPYYVASRQVGRQIILKTNPNYKGPRPHNIDTFVVHDEHEPRPEPAPGQGRPGRLRRGRPSADGARRARPAVRHQQGPQYYVNRGSTSTTSR